MDSWIELDSMADLAELPREWLTCPVCAEFFWRFPPHGFNPCPVAVGMAEAAGLKLDAERMAAVKAGVHLEDMSKAVRQYIEEHGFERGDDGEEEEDE